MSDKRNPRCPDCKIEGERLDPLTECIILHDGTIHEWDGADCLRRQLAQRYRCGCCGKALALNESGSPLPCETCVSLAQQEVAEGMGERIAEFEATFDLRHKADCRAIKMWQEAGGKELVHPDHADLVVWLLGELDRLRAIVLACGENYCGHIQLTSQTPRETEANATFRQGLQLAADYRAAAEVAKKENPDDPR